MRNSALPRVFAYVYAGYRGRCALLAWNITCVGDIAARAALYAGVARAQLRRKDLAAYCRAFLRHVWVDFDHAIAEGAIAIAAACRARGPEEGARPKSPPPPPHSVTCVVCLERVRATAAVACGHVSTCGACARELRACPICRQKTAWLPLWWA